MKIEKFSLVNHDSFQKIHDISDRMADKIEIYIKLMAFAKKFGPAMIGIVLETAASLPSSGGGGGGGRSGFGYELASSFIGGTQFSQGTDIYSLVFTYPPKLDKELIEKHMKHMISFFLGNELDQKVKFFFEQVYFLFRFNHLMKIGLNKDALYFN